MTSSRLDHVSLSVTDLERSIWFYRDILGIPLLGTGEEEFAELAELLNAPRARFRFADLDLGDGRILELLQYLEPRGSRVDRRLPDPGISHFGVRVSDLAATLQSLDSHGVPIRSTTINLEAPAWWAGAKVAYVSDPDGAVVELVERPSP